MLPRPSSFQLAFPSPFFSDTSTSEIQIMCCPWRPEKGGGAAAGPLAGERVPHEGERGAAEQICGGALWPKSVGRWVWHA
jgi:hypothetical protein